MCNTAVGVLLYTGSETWLFDDGDWALQSQGAQPPGRGATALTRFGDGALMFGGQGAAGMMNDTWVWTAAEGWTELKPSARAPDEGSPVGRSMHSLATFDMGGRDGELVVMFGGATTGEPRMTALGDTWVLATTHGNRWYQKVFNDTIIPGTTIEHAAAPPARWGHSMICHDAPAGPLKKGYCMMFGGGVTQDDHFTDTWRFDFGELKQAHGWSLVVPVQTATTDPPLGMPPGRWSYQMAACGSGALMATGSTGYRVCTDDTWVWDPAPVKSAWCETAHRFSHAWRRFSVDEHRSSFAKAGSGQPVQGALTPKEGFLRRGPSHDQNGSWTMQQPATHPGHLGGAAMATVTNLKNTSPKISSGSGKKETATGPHLQFTPRALVATHRRCCVYVSKTRVVRASIAPE